MTEEDLAAIEEQCLRARLARVSEAAASRWKHEVSPSSFLANTIPVLLAEIHAQRERFASARRIGRVRALVDASARVRATDFSRPTAKEECAADIETDNMTAESPLQNNPASSYRTSSITNTEKPPMAKAAKKTTKKDKKAKKTTAKRKGKATKKTTEAAP